MFIQGAKAGAGFFFGWFLAKWFFTFIIICTIVFGTCHIIARGEDDKNNSMNKIEKSLKIDLISPARGLRAGRPVRYSLVCNVRTAPSIHSEKIGKVIKGKEYTVLAKKGNWRMIQLSDSHAGWAGCKP